MVHAITKVVGIKKKCWLQDDRNIVDAMFTEKPSSAIF